MANRDTKLSIIIEARNKAEAAFAQMNKSLKDAQSNVENLSGSLKTVGTYGVAAFAGLATAAFAFVKAGAEFEQTQVAFTTMIGSAEEANALLKDMAQFASNTPFQLTDLEHSTKSLLAYGVSAKQIIPTLKMLGNISAGVGMDKMPQLILAFGQVRAATKLTGSELRQFSEAGVPLLGELAKQLNASESEVLDMVSAGQIGFPMVEQALTSLTMEGGRFYNLMESQSSTLLGLWSNLQDQISLTARSIGQELVPVLKPAIDYLITLMEHIRAFVEENPKFSAGIIIVSTALAAMLALLLPIGIAFNGLVLAMPLLSAGLAAVKVAVLAVNAAMLLWGFIIVGIGALIYNLIYNWQDLWDMIVYGTAKMANAIQVIFESVVNFFIDGINYMIEKVNTLIDKLNSIPGMDNRIGKIDTFERVQLQRFDTDLLLNDLIYGDRATGKSTVVNITGNTLLDDDAAEKIGDQMMSRLKLSNAI